MYVCMHVCIYIYLCVYIFICMYVCMNMRTTSRAYCALPLVGGACSALVHLLWILGAWCPDFSAPLPTCSACWVLTLFAHCVAMPGSVASEGIRWQSPLACAATLPFVCAVFASIFSLAIRTWCPYCHTSFATRDAIWISTALTSFVAICSLLLHLLAHRERTLRASIVSFPYAPDLGNALMTRKAPSPFLFHFPVWEITGRQHPPAIKALAIGVCNRRLKT